MPRSADVPVSIGEARRQAVSVTIETVGTVEAYRTVTVYSRVSGNLLKIHFREGEDVAKDTLLFTVDPAPFEERLREAEAHLARDQAALTYRQAEAERINRLLGKGAASKSDYEQSRTDVRVYQEAVKASRAELQEARLDLSYCAIRSPMAGQAGVYLAHEGALVKSNMTPTQNRILRPS